METEQKQDDSPYGSFRLSLFFSFSSSRLQKLIDFLSSSSSTCRYPSVPSVLSPQGSPSIDQSDDADDRNRRRTQESHRLVASQVGQEDHGVPKGVWTHHLLSWYVLHLLTSSLESLELTSFPSLRSNSSEHHGDLRSQRAHLPRRSPGSQVTRGFLRCYRRGCGAFS